MLKKRIGQFLAGLALLALLAGVGSITVDLSSDADGQAIACNESTGSGGGC